MATSLPMPTPDYSLTPDQLAELSDRSLLIRFLEPVLAPLRGASDIRKKEAFDALPQKLRPLFLLRVLDGHAAGSAWEYYVWTGMLLQTPDTWAGLLAAFRELGSLELLETLADTAAVHRKRLEGKSPAPPPAASDFEREPGLRAEMEALHAAYEPAVAEAYRAAAERVRSALHQAAYPPGAGTGSE